jgi:hypothetical protein
MSSPVGCDGSRGPASIRAGTGEYTSTSLVGHHQANAHPRVVLEQAADFATRALQQGQSRCIAIAKAIDLGVDVKDYRDPTASHARASAPGSLQRLARRQPEP